MKQSWLLRCHGDGGAVSSVVMVTAAQSAALSWLRRRNQQRCHGNGGSVSSVVMVTVAQSAALSCIIIIYHNFHGNAVKSRLLPIFRRLSVCFIHLGSICVLIIYHDFLPTPRRGSHVKSDKTHTQSSRYTS